MWWWRRLERSHRRICSLAGARLARCHFHKVNQHLSFTRSLIILTFTRSMSSLKKSAQDKPKFRSVANVIRAGIMVDRWMNINYFAIGLFRNVLLTTYKCTKHQFIHLLTATLNNLHIENSKNHKRWYYSAAHWHTQSVWCGQYHLLWFLLFSMCDFFNVAVNKYKLMFCTCTCCFMTKILCALDWADTASALDKCNLSSPKISHT